MFKEDLDKAAILAEFQDKFDWPKRLFVSSGKNQKKRVMKVASLLKGAMFAGGAMQTTDQEILKTIKRSNISLEELGPKPDDEKGVDEVDSYTELILALPGDSVNAQSKSLRDMVEIGVNRVRMYQLIMLKQTEMNTLESRNKYGLQTRFRLMPRSFGNYELFGEKFSAVEFEEICVANNTMSFEEYLDCREMDLTIEIINNGRLFHELSGLCKMYGFSWFDVILAFHNNRRSVSSDLAQLYDEFRNDSTQGLWENRDELESLVKSKINEYLANEEGTNEMAKAKAKAVFKLQEEIHNLLFSEVRSKLQELELLDSTMEQYLEELKVYSLFRKKALVDTSIQNEGNFHFNFLQLQKKGFVMNPKDYMFDKPQVFFFRHSEEQIKLLDSYAKQYGTSLDGLGRLLMRAQYHTLIRTAVLAESNSPIKESCEVG